MKSRLVSSIILTFLLLLILSVEVFAWGPITHMTLLADIINDPRLNQDIKKVLQENLRYSKGGAMGPDLFYFSDKRFADIAHYCSTNSLATSVLDTAKKSGKSQNIAYAYGWMIHVAADSRGHQWVNSIVGGEYDPNNSTIKKAHRDVELSIDTLNEISHNYVLENMFYNGSYKTISDAYKSLYGCDKNAPTIQDYRRADNLLFALLSNYGAMQRDPYKFNTPEYYQAYQGSIDRAIEALNSSGASLLNYDLDTGLMPGDTYYTGDQKCKNQCQLDKYCTPVPTPTPGGDHPDDTVSVDSGNSTFEEVSLDSLYRLAAKKGKTWVLWQKALQDANAEYEALPPDASPELRQEKLNKISALLDMLNDPFNYREFTINNPQLSTETIEVPDVAVLENGYFEDTTGLINKHKEPVKTIATDFNPAIVKNHPVMIIPSGGLYGLENSTFLKASLDEYVKQGGTLIVFAQQHGYEFNILPVPQEADGTFKIISGYGWIEDQSCFTNAVYLDTQHQMLSSISKATPTLSVDGYFTNYPSNTTVLLRRTANGQPSMIMYDYGQGKIIVSSMYTDFAMSHNQASSEELSLVRDMISWSKAPAQLPEIKQGETVSVPIEVVNNADTDAASAKLLIYNPDRSTLLSEQTINLSIPAGQTDTISVSYTSSSTSTLGIYHIDYELYDANGSIIQPQAETDSGRFVVSNPPTTPYQNTGLKFSVNSDSEHYAYGSDAVFTVTIWNSGDKDRTITAGYYTYHLNVSGSPKTVVVPAHSSASFQVIASNVVHEGWLVVKFYDENNKYMTERWKGIWMFQPSVKINVKSDKALYAKGEAVNLTLNLQNSQSSTYNTDIKIRVLDPSNTVVYSNTLSVSLPANGTSTQNLTFALSPSAQGGYYTVSAEAYDSSGNKIGNDSSSFELPLSIVSVAFVIPQTLSTGSNSIQFVLSNKGKINISSGILDISLKDPEGIVVYSKKQAFALTVGQDITLNSPVSISSLKFGNYMLSYTQSDETKTGKPSTIIIPNTTSIVFSFDKSSYRIRETAILNVNLTNAGKFNLNSVLMTVSAPDANYSETKTISLETNNSSSLAFTIPVPDTVTAGQHNVNVSVALPSGSLISKSEKLIVPESLLEIEYSGANTISSGETISLMINNTGGVDTSYTTEKLTMKDSKGLIIYQGNLSGTALAGESKTLTTIQIPAQAAAGLVLLSSQIKDGNTLKTTNFYRTFEITGLMADFQTMTDKAAYLKTEAITAITNIANENIGIENGNLKIKVSRIRKTGEWQFTKWGNYGTGDGQFKTPYGIAVDDKYVYVSDYYNHRIQIFDKSTHAFVGKFGSYGSGEGQFLSPQGIAVDNSYIYVGDIYGYRIQVFNKLTYAYVGVIGKRMITYPYGLAVDDKYIYVAAQSGLHVFDKTTYALKTNFGYGFNHPFNIAVDDSRIYATDVYNNRVQVFNKATYAIIGMFGSSGSGDGQFNKTVGVAVDSSYIYVTDIGGKLQIFDKDSYAFIGRITPPDNTSLVGLIAMDGSTIYLANVGYNCIQKIEPVGGGTETLYDATIPFNQATNTIQDYTTNIGTLNVTGKLYLNAELKNTLGQTIATSEYPFYIIEGNTLLLFATDKKVYKPGETVTITGGVRNLATITASALSLQLSANSLNIYTATFDVPANGSHPFTITTTAGIDGTYTLTGKVTQNNSVLVEITDSYEVANPKVSATVSAPEVAGNEPFNINVEMKNEGKVNASIQLSAVSDQGNTTDDQQITIPAGKTKLIQYSQQVTSDTIYTFTFYGDLDQTITKTVKYGLSASVSVDVSNGVYPEGRIAIPVTTNNTGQLDETLEVIFQLSSQQSVISSQNKTYYVPKGGNVTDTLYYDLTEGEYQLTANSQLPTASSQANFSIKKENKVDMAVSLGTQTNELIPVTMNLANIGYNSIGGSIRYTVVNSQNAAVWSGDTAVSQLLPQNSQLITFNINPAAIATGNYTLNVELLNDSGQQLAAQGLPITIQGPIFQITQSPLYQTFFVDQEATFTFRIKNTGNQEGAFDFNLKAYDLIDSTQREWLKPGEEKAITFNFLLPEDLEEKDYFADYELKDQGPVVKGQVKYHIAGIALDVNASLDKQYYHEGETARLTILISQQSALGSQNLFAMVNYNGYEDQQPFTLNGSYALTFDIPLTNITGEKLFYGIYYESGRSIHLNSLYIYKAGDVITIITDKQVYNPGDIVSVAVNCVSGITKGTMTLSGPNYTETFEFSGIAIKSFTLPSTMTAGTYYISYQLSAISGEIYTGNHPFDVAGISVKVKEATLDKGKYASSDTMQLTLTIESNQNLSAILKTWIVDPEGEYTGAGDSNIVLSSTEPLLFADTYSLSTSVSGIHRLVYGIYIGDLLLVSGSEAFDVGNAVLLGISTHKTDYLTNTEPVNVKVSMFGTVDAKFELVLDGTTVETQSVSLNGFVTLDIEIGIVEPGTHILKDILTAGGLRSTKETSFVYGSSLPDLVISSQQSGVRKDNTIQITATVTNQGKTASNATTISVYDGDPELVSGLIETKAINALNSGDSQEVGIFWNVLGKAGEHTIKAVVDPDNLVIEFNEENNTATMNILIPDITLITETDKDIYKIMHKVNILSTITNLTGTKTYDNLVLTTSVKDSSGNEVCSKSTLIDTIQPLNTITLTQIWDTTGLPVEGAYTIVQTVISDQVLAQRSKLITLEKAPDFTLRTDTDYQKIKQGEKAAYTVYLESLNGWNSEITLSIEGLPAEASAVFSPGNLIPPGKALTVITEVITKGATPPSTYTLNLKAERIDEGEVITHTLPLTLDVSGFGLKVEPLNRTIQQLECATYNISLLSMNEYEGEINLSIDKLPYGVNAYFEKSISQVPGNVKLTAQTSKYVRPGTYTFTITGDNVLVEHTIDLTLNINANPEISAGIITTQGPGPNNETWVRLFNSTTQPVFDLMAFDTKYGANVVSADIDGDGYDEIIVSQGPDPKNTATLRVFKRDGTTVAEYTAFDSKYGLTLSSADLDGDWLDELIVGMGPDPKNPAQVRILKYNGNGFAEIMTQTVYTDLKYGLNTTTGDIDGDGLPEIITAPGPGPNNPAIIEVWKNTGVNMEELNSFTAFEGNYGANISNGDIDGDGKAEIITGTGPDPKIPSTVRVFKSDGRLMLELRPYDNKYGYGVTVATTDIDDDGIDEIITGLGFGSQNPSWVKVFKADGTEIASFLAYPDNIGYGVKVSTGRVGK